MSVDVCFFSFIDDDLNLTTRLVAADVRFVAAAEVTFSGFMWDNLG